MSAWQLTLTMCQTSFCTLQAVCLVPASVQLIIKQHMAYKCCLISRSKASGRKRYRAAITVQTEGGLVYSSLSEDRVSCDKKEKKRKQ